MNIDYANTVPLRDILDKMGFTPSTSENHILKYRSPFDESEEAVLTVNTSTNTWHENTLQTGGKALSLICAYLHSQHKNSTPADALRWIKSTVGYVLLQIPKGLTDYSEMDGKYLVKDSSYVSSGFLIAYLEDERRIPLGFAIPFVKELTVLNQESGKEFKALGIVNEDGGFAFRNDFIKGNTTPQNLTFVRGTVEKPDTIHLFKDMMDYLSAITHNGGKKFKGDVIILNAAGNMARSAGYIRHYGYAKAVTWFDNTDEGNAITHRYRNFFKSEPGLKHLVMNNLYKDYKDVNAWCVDKFPQARSSK